MADRARLTVFFEKRHPESLPKVDLLLDKYAGREDELFQLLVQKYGPEPSTSSSSSSTTSALYTTLPPSTSEYHWRVQNMYLKYCPEKLTSGMVAKTLGKYAGQEEMLIRALVQKYGPEPTTDGAHPTFTTDGPVSDGAEASAAELGA